MRAPRNDMDFIYSGYTCSQRDVIPKKILAGGDVGGPFIFSSF